MYNTFNRQLLEYAKEPSILKLLRRLNSDRNLYVIKIKNGEIDSVVSRFIKDIRGSYCGDIIDTAHRPRKPVQLKPLLKLHGTLPEMSTGRSGEKTLVKDEIKDYLNALTLYINSNCNRDCGMCNKAHKQFTCCTRGTSGNTLTIQDIRGLLEEINGSKLFKINISGGDLATYPNLPELLALLEPLPAVKNYFQHYLNLDALQHKTPFFQLARNSISNLKNCLNILVHFPLQKNIFQKWAEQSHRLDIKKRYHFIVQSDDQFDTVEDLINRYPFEDFLVSPYFNGQNMSFFQTNVFTDRESLLEESHTMKDIFSRAAINRFYFKNLSLLSNKGIYANLNGPQLGILGKNKIFDVIHKELNNGKSWTRVRRHVMPCKSCVFTDLCPPITNYEFATKMYDLCHIKTNS